MTRSLEALRHRLQAIADGVRADWGIYVKFLATGEEIAIRADVPMDTMSVIKVPLILELHRQAELGLVDLERRLELEQEHKRLGTGVLVSGSRQGRTSDADLAAAIDGMRRPPPCRTSTSTKVRWRERPPDEVKWNSQPGKKDEP